jgi:ADP-ribose pyrophosphatase
MLGDANSGPPVSRHLVRRGAKFDFEIATYPGPDGTTLEREVVRHPGAVVVLPVLAGAAGDRVVLIRNWRVSVERRLLELPAGTLERGEEPASAAARELTEETGFSAATMTPLGWFYTSPGLSDERMWAFVAGGLAAGPQRLEADERIEVCVMTASECLNLISTGELCDAKSVLTLLRAVREGLVKVGTSP